jgi:competence protein ComEC
VPSRLTRPEWLAAGVVAAAAASAVGGLAAGAILAGGVVVAAWALAAGRRASGAGLAAAALGAALVLARLAVAGMAAEPAGAAPASAPLPEEAGSWRATVLASRTVGGQQLATLRLDEPRLTCSGQLAAYPRLVAGDTIDWTGRVRPLGESDYDSWLAGQGIQARCDATTFGVSGRDGSLVGRLEGLRQSSGDALQRVLPEPEGGLSAAILVGLRDRVDRDVAGEFTTAGVSHIVAISGWNIAIVAATVSALLGGLARRRRTAATIAAIVGYTLFAGASPSVVRAAVMAGVALTGLESGRGSRAATGLAWAVALMILAEPASVADVGFQLSAAATAGLILWATPIALILERRATPLPGPIRESLGVSLAAQAATLPIVLLAFGRLALIAPLANLVAVPLVPPAMAAGALALGAGWLVQLGVPGWLTGLLALPEWALLAALIGVVHAAASVPGANATLPFPANAGAAALAGALLLPLHRHLAGAPADPERRGADAAPSGRAALSSRATPSGRATLSGRRACRPGSSRLRRWAAVGGAFLVALAGFVVAARPDGSLHVVVLDVGQGDGILIEGDRGARILVDGGPDGATLLAALDRYVPPWDRRLDAIVLTHPHDDHVGGLTAAVDRYRVGRVFESGWPASSPPYLAWRDAILNHDIAASRLRTGDTIQVDGATLRVLWPDDGTVRPPELDPSASDNRRTNDSSIVILGEFAGRRFLLMGDAEDDVDPILLARGLPRVDLLKVAHHGSATASSEPLLAALSPRVAVVSVGAENPYGHPAPSTMARLRAHAAEVYRTDQDGTVETTLNATSVAVETERASAARDARADRALAAAASTGPESGGPTGFLYDSGDVRAEPPRERGTAALTRSARLAPSPRSRRRRDGGLAGPAHRRARSIARPPPGRSRRSAPRRRQAGHGEGFARRAGPRGRIGRLAGPARLPGAGARDRRAPCVAPGRYRLVRDVAPLRVARGSRRGLRRQAGRAATAVDGFSVRRLGAALPARREVTQSPGRLVARHHRAGAPSRRDARGARLRAGWRGPGRGAPAGLDGPRAAPGPMSPPGRGAVMAPPATPSAPLGYYWGDDSYGVARGPDSLAARLAGDGAPVERVRLSGASTNAEEIAERVATATLFGGGTLIIVAEPAPLVSTKPLAARLTGVFAGIAEGNGLAFLDTVDGTARRPASLEALRDAVAGAGGEVREFKAPTREGMARWIAERARERGIDIAGPATVLLAERVGAFVRERDVDRRRQGELAVAELEKLALYRLDAQVRPEDVKALVADAVPGSTWAFLDAVGMRHAAEAAELADRLDEVPSPVLVVHLHRRLRELIQVADLLAAGTPAAALVRKLKLNPYRAQMLASQARGWTLAELETALAGLLELDATLKARDGGGETRRRSAVSLWIAEYVRRR